MATLTTEEQAQLEALTAKAEAPEPERVVEIRVDLGDEKQVRRAVRCGYLDEQALDGFEDDGEDDDGEDDDGEDGKTGKPQGLPKSKSKPKPKAAASDDDDDERFQRRYR